MIYYAPLDNLRVQFIWKPKNSNPAVDRRKCVVLITRFQLSDEEKARVIACLPVIIARWHYATACTAPLICSKEAYIWEVDTKHYMGGNYLVWSL